MPHRAHVRVFYLVTLLIVCLFSLPSCGSRVSHDEHELEKPAVAIGVCDFESEVATAPLVAYAQKENSHLANYSIANYNSLDELIDEMNQGTLSFACMSPEQAAQIYNQSRSDIVIVAVTKLCSSYIVGHDTNVYAITDLSNQPIYVSRDDVISQQILVSILQSRQEPLDRYSFVWCDTQEQAYLRALEDPQAYALIYQPKLTQIRAVQQNLSIVFDVNQEWTAAHAGVKQETSRPVDRVLVAHTRVIKEQASLVQDCMSLYKNAVRSLENRPQDYVSAFSFLQVKTQDIQDLMLNQCNFIYLDGEEMRLAVSGYFKYIYRIDPMILGRILPDNGLYYGVSGI